MIGVFQDVKTPDEWVKRNPELVRLTGKHPFNTEAPLTPLFDAVSALLVMGDPVRLFTLALASCRASLLQLIYTLCETMVPSRL